MTENIFEQCTLTIEARKFEMATVVRALNTGILVSIQNNQLTIDEEAALLELQEGILEDTDHEKVLEEQMRYLVEEGEDPPVEAIDYAVTIGGADDD